MYLAYAICSAVCIWPNASCCFAGVSKERTTFVREGLFISSCSGVESSCLPPISELPSGSWYAGNDTGENSPEVAGVPEANAMLCEDPHAIFVMWCSFSEGINWGFLLGATVLFPCWPCSLSPHEYTYTHVKGFSLKLVIFTWVKTPYLCESTMYYVCVKMQVPTTMQSVHLQRERIWESTYTCNGVEWLSEVV